MKIKKCSRCKEKKELGEFSKDKSRKDELGLFCKKCVKAKRDKPENKARANSISQEYYQDNKEGILARNKEHRQNNKETVFSYHKEYRQKNKETVLAKKKEYRQNNKKAIAAYQKEYYRDNKKPYTAQKKEYRQKNKAKIKEYYQDNKEGILVYQKEYEQSEKGKVTSQRSSRKRRAMKEGIKEIPLTEQELAFIYKQFSDCCYLCISKDNLCLDHHFPLSKGYPLHMGNITLLCKSCNSKKHDSLPKDFYLEPDLQWLDGLHILQIKLFKVD